MNGHHKHRSHKSNRFTRRHFGIEFLEDRNLLAFGLPTTYVGETLPEDGLITYGATAATIGDFNGDGAQDFAFEDHDTQTISVFANVKIGATGTGDFYKFATLDVNQSSNTPLLKIPNEPGAKRPLQLVGADFNNDGKSDLAVGFAGNIHVNGTFFPGFIKFYAGSVTGLTLVNENANFNPGLMVAGQFDAADPNDRIDLAVLQADSNLISQARNDGNFSFTKVQSPPLITPDNQGITFVGLQADAIVGDSRTDLVGFDATSQSFVAIETTTETFNENDGPQTQFNVAKYSAVNDQIKAFRLRDLDGDTVMDIAAVSETKGYFIHGNADGTFTKVFDFSIAIPGVIGIDDLLAGTFAPGGQPALAASLSTSKDLAVIPLSAVNGGVLDITKVQLLHTEHFGGQLGTRLVGADFDGNGTQDIVRLAGDNSNNTKSAVADVFQDNRDTAGSLQLTQSSDYSDPADIVQFLASAKDYLGNALTEGNVHFQILRRDGTVVQEMDSPVDFSGQAPFSASLPEGLTAIKATYTSGLDPTQTSQKTVFHVAGTDPAIFTALVNYEGFTSPDQDNPMWTVENTGSAGTGQGSVSEQPGGGEWFMFDSIDNGGKFYRRAESGLTAMADANLSATLRFVRDGADNLLGTGAGAVAFGMRDGERLLQFELVNLTGTTGVFALNGAGGTTVTLDDVTIKNRIEISKKDAGANVEVRVNGVSKLTLARDVLPADTEPADFFFGTPSSTEKAYVAWDQVKYGIGKANFDVVARNVADHFTVLLNGQAGGTAAASAQSDLVTQDDPGLTLVMGDGTLTIIVMTANPSRPPSVQVHLGVNSDGHSRYSESLSNANQPDISSQFTYTFQLRGEPAQLGEVRVSGVDLDLNQAKSRYDFC